MKNYENESLAVGCAYCGQTITTNPQFVAGNVLHAECVEKYSEELYDDSPLEFLG